MCDYYTTTIKGIFFECNTAKLLTHEPLLLKYK